MNLIKYLEISFLAAWITSVIRLKTDFSILNISNFLQLQTFNSPRVTVNYKLSTVN